MAHEPSVDRSDTLDAGDAFELFADETRVAIVRELGDAWSPQDREPVSFSRLRRLVNVEDGGRLDYHLKRLLGSFVERTDDGYGLTPIGVRVYQTMRAGTFNEHVTVAPFELDDACVRCGDPLLASYRNLLFEIGCDGCEYRHYRDFVPPGRIADASTDEMLDALDATLRSNVTAVTSGTCPVCTGSLAVTVGPDVGYLFADKDHEAHAACDCGHCGSHAEFSVGELVLDHPAMVSFLYRRGVSVTERYRWTFDVIHDPSRTALRSTDPVRVAVTARADGDERTLVVDEQCSVVAVEPSPAEGSG